MTTCDKKMQSYESRSLNVTNFDSLNASIELLNVVNLNLNFSGKRRGADIRGIGPTAFLVQTPGENYSSK